MSSLEVVENDMPPISSTQVNQEYQQASRQFSEMGAEDFIQGVASNAIKPSVGAHLFLGSVLAGPGSNKANNTTGFRFLAMAFAESSHIDGVAGCIRSAFGALASNPVDRDEAELAFNEHLQKCNASEQVFHRFSALLHGSLHNKVFAVGFNKTGTTSVLMALAELGILTAPQQEAERMFRDWAARRFDRIIDFASRYEAFQDIPFSLPYTYQALDQAFPDARFVLTVRTSPDEWYDSLLRFCKQVFHKGGEPNWPETAACGYNYPGFVNEVAHLFWRWNDFGLYDRNRALALYQTHNLQVQEYFSSRPEKLLTINVADTDSYKALCGFIGREPRREVFEKLNASQ
ncbi:sulfotransferase [Denitrobaculum tricleocarpae]|uniref:Sulfotransferase family protein n=1 Tax=Denitrobaculum tricleocarpae TaxID=2591009 RepID=A0A545TFX0_9PROT|nr:sulfotransferase [Denitrobaculum tricleocarpae]TQV76119.1 hypothetical protein FKG95_20960 [Denitrobaculum tricleocarpae]